MNFFVTMLFIFLTTLSLGSCSFDNKEKVTYVVTQYCSCYSKTGFAYCDKTLYSKKIHKAFDEYTNERNRFFKKQGSKNTSPQYHEYFSCEIESVKVDKLSASVKIKFTTLDIGSFARRNKDLYGMQNKKDQIAQRLKDAHRDGELTKIEDETIVELIKENNVWKLSEQPNIFGKNYRKSLFNQSR